MPEPPSPPAFLPPPVPPPPPPSPLPPPQPPPQPPPPPPPSPSQPPRFVSQTMIIEELREECLVETRRIIPEDYLHYVSKSLISDI